MDTRLPGLGIEDSGLVALAPGLSLEFLVEERSEGPGVLCLHGVAVDEDLLEERLVGESADAVWGVSIDGVTVADQLDAVVELGFCLGIVGVGFVEAGVDACEHVADAVLLVLELVQWDRAGVVGLEELVSLRLEITLLFGQVVDLHLRLGVEDGELFGDDGLERSLCRLVELDCRVVVDDELLDAIHVHGLAGAAGFASGAGLRR